MESLYRHCTWKREDAPAQRRGKANHGTTDASSRSDVEMRLGQMRVSPAPPPDPSFDGISGDQVTSRWPPDGVGPWWDGGEHETGPLVREGNRDGCQSVSWARRYPFPLSTKVSQRSVRRSAMTWALRASGNTFGQSLNARFVVIDVDRRWS